MRKQLLTQASLLIVRLTVMLTLALSGSQRLAGQTVYPIQGQAQGGDRRGTYLYDNEKMQEVYDETGTLPRLYQDPKTYLHNMKLLAHLPGSFGMGDMMTVGGNRYLFLGPGVVDVTDPENPVIINNESPRGEVAYNQSLQKWILMQANSCCSVTQDVARGLVPHPEDDPTRGGRHMGVTFFDVTDPRNIVEISRFSTPPGSSGTHSDGNYYDGGRYAYLSSALPTTRGQAPFHLVSRILQIIDVSDINNPTEVSTWWVPGQLRTEETEYLQWPEAEPEPKDWSPEMHFHFATFHGPCYVPRRVEDGGDRGYCAWGSLGMRVLDFSNIRQPRLVSTVDLSPPFDGGIPVHNAYPMPQRKLVFMNGEADRWDCRENVVMPWVVDMRAEEYPVTIATFPIPKPPENAPYNDFCLRGGRFGIHHPQNLKAPGEQRIDLMGYSWFAGGFRLYDVSNAFRPEEVAWILPAMGQRRGTEAAFIEWDRKIIHVFADSGLYILSSPVLGEPALGPLEPQRWNVEGLNKGMP